VEIRREAVDPSARKGEPFQFDATAAQSVIHRLCWIDNTGRSFLFQEHTMGYVYVAMTVLLTVYGQLAIKWQVNHAGALPADGAGRIAFYTALLLNPWVISAIVAAFAAMLSWMAAMTRFELSHAYPFMAANFVLVGLASIWLFNEPLTWNKVIGVGLICLGLFVVARS
jgi:multidrug transporter EmrE-like cation transporter